MQSVKKLYKKAKFWYIDNHAYKFYSKQFKAYLEMNCIPNEPAEGEDEYIKNWKRLSSRVEPYSYRLFSKYFIEKEMRKYIVPEDIGNTVIEHYLNPIQYKAFYKDKNMFAKYLTPKDSLPKELLRRIDGGCFLDAGYKVSKINGNSSQYEIAREFEECQRIIIKPSANSCSGVGVKLFTRTQNSQGESSFADENGIYLNGGYLNKYNYGNNFVIQEAIVQHPYLSQFCSTSVNTIRLCTYRSVLDEKVLVFAAALRIGHEGSVVDNLHAGGGFVNIDVTTGVLGHVIYDQYGRMSDSINDIDIHNDFQIPHWDQIRDFGISIAKQNRHMRLLALDVTLDIENHPRLMEYNVEQFAFWIPMFMGKRVFGDRIEEVIEYCHCKLLLDHRI